MSNAAITAADLLAAIARPDRLILRSDAAAVGLERELRTEFESGHPIRLRRGIYVLATEWAQLTIDDRYLCRVRAYAAPPPHCGTCRRSALGRHPFTC
jgi:hypothetical protein